MRLLGHLFAIIFLALLLGYTSDARMPDLGFDLLDHEKGLSNDAVRCLLQDRTGFLWVGTENGLNRYDGTRFTVYRNQADRPESLSGNLVTSLFEDRDGNLWVGTFDAGLNRFRPESNDFERVPISTSGSEKLFPTVYIMAQAPDGSLWFGAQGSLFAGDPKTGKFRRFYKPGGIKQLVFDQKGLLWVGGNFGLSVFDPSGNTFFPVRDFPVQNQPFGVGAIRLHPDGRIFVGTSKGVLAFDTTTRNKVGEWNIETTSKGRSWLTSVSALVIPPDDPNMVWVGTPGQGIWRINLSANRVEKARSRLGLPGEIPDLAPSCFLFDRTGILWVGDSRYGLGKYSRFNHRFMLYRHNPLMSNSLSDNYIRGMFRNRDGFLWVGTQYGGLNRINLATNEVTCYRHDPARSDSIPSDCVWTVYQDRGGTLWVGAIGGFGTFDPQTGRFAGLPYVTPTTLVTSVLEDRNGHLWFFNHTELLEMSPDRVILRKIPISRLFPAVTTFHSQDILEDRFGELWLAGEQAVIRFDPKTGASHVFPPVFFRQQPGGEFLPTCLMETATGELWLSTKRDGIFRYDRARDAFVGIQERDGLPNNDVYGLLEAEDGTIWMSTDGGVCKYNPKTGQFRTFGPSDGLQGFEFNRRAFCKGPDGQMFFGGIKGLNNFFPRDIRENVTPPPVVLTELTSLKGKAWFPTSVQKELILPYDENTFTIRFAALDFNAPEKNRYSYRLVGFDDMTVETNSPEALYRNLPPGEYRFTVRGANNDGIWSSGETTLRLKVLPPWWRSWWAYFGYACAAGFLLFGGFKMQTNRLLLRSKLREAVLQSQIDAGVIQIQRIEQEALENENRRQAEANERLLEIDRIKQSFTAMLVHDIKSPLSSVKLVLDLISLENLQIVPEKRQLLEGSQRNLDQVLTLANELLDVFKSDFQEIQLIKIPVSLHDLLNRCLQVIHPAALAKGITLSHSFSDELPPISGDPGKLERVFVNLLSNAVKFTPENGTITLLATTIEGTEMEEGERSLMIRVTDTGPGIPPEDLPYIFDPYRQSTSGYRKVGVGLGLAIVKRIVAAHGGNVTVRSKVGVGSTFAVTLPLPDLTEKSS